jgi:hypothetical protein
MIKDKIGTIGKTHGVKERAKPKAQKIGKIMCSLPLLRAFSMRLSLSLFVLLLALGALLAALPAGLAAGVAVVLAVEAELLDSALPAVEALAPLLLADAEELLAGGGVVDAVL